MDLKQLEAFIKFIDLTDLNDFEDKENIRVIIEDIKIPFLFHFSTKDTKEIHFDEGESKEELIYTIDCDFGYFEWDETEKLIESVIKKFKWTETLNLINALL